MSEKKRRCQAVTKTGRPCRAWALRPSPAEKTEDRPALCRVHTEQAARERAAPPADVTLPPPLEGTPVTAGTLAGAYGTRQLYGLFFDQEEIAALEALAAEASDGESLAAEVEMARVLLRRLLALLAASGELLTITPVLLETARTIAELLLARQKLTAKGENELPDWMYGALDHLNEEWDLDFKL